MNYPDRNIPFTRIHEFKHLHPERKDEMSRAQTIISREFSRVAGVNDDPYYPINASGDREKINAYRKLTSEVKNTIFGGRLGSYQYLDMHMAIASALQTFETDITQWWAINRD